MKFKSCLLAVVILFSTFAIFHATTIFADNISTEWKTYHAIPKFAITQPYQNQTFNFQYGIINGTIESFQLVQSSNSFTAQIKDTEKTPGEFVIKIPRNYPYTNENITSPANLIVLSDRQVVKNFNMEKTDCFYDYAIPFSHDSVIELIFSYIPENSLYHGDKISPNCLHETMSQNLEKNDNVSIPEFPFTIPVFIISLASLIIFYRIKFG